MAALRVVEEQTGKKLGDAENPLLVSVRSGAKFSMPGMMDTVLNLGLNDETVKGLIAKQRRRALLPTTPIAASSRCSPRSCSTPKPTPSSTRSPNTKRRPARKTDAEIPAEALKRMVDDFKQIARDASGTRRSPRSR